MAIAIQSSVNRYDPRLEGLTKTDLTRRGLASGGFQEDAANKAFGGPSHEVNFTTTDATATEIFLSLGAAFTRSIPNPLGSPSLPDQLVLSGVDVTTVQKVRKISVEIEQNIAGVRNYVKLVGVVRNAATPTVGTALAVVEGAFNAAGGACAFTFSAGQVNVTITGVAATNITWVAKVFVDDLR